MEVGALRSGDPERLGTYALIGRVGEGGQGTVFLGTDEDGRRVAIKLLHSELTSDDKARARFLRELDVAKRVAPFCTAQVIDADADGDRPYIVSEYVPGPSLHQLVGEQGPLGGAALERLAVGTATALSAIHQAEIIHRDFKPHNVLIGSDGPRVIDFGVARAISGSTTLTSKVIGTPSYMAPEQIQGEEIGTAADVFCWAATLVYAATGSSPFGQDSIPAVINRILNQQPKLGDLDGPLRELVLDCLSKDPAARPKARQVLMRLLGHDDTGPTPAVVTDPVAHDDEDATAMLAVGSVLAAELGDDEDDLATPGVMAAGGAAGAGLGAAAAQALGDSAGTDPYDVVSDRDAAHYDAGGRDAYAPGGHDAGGYGPGEYDAAGYDAGGSASSETQVVRALPDEVAHDDPYSEEEARHLPTPAEWLERNTLPGSGGKRPGSPRGRQRRVAALAGAAALLIAAGIASAAFALSGNGGAQPSTRVGDPSNTAPAQTSVDPTTDDDGPTYPTHVPRRTESPTPTPSDTSPDTPSESPTPTPSHTPTPTPSDTPSGTPTPPDTSPPPTKTPPPTDPPTKPAGGTSKTTGGSGTPSGH